MVRLWILVIMAVGLIAMVAYIVALQKEGRKDTKVLVEPSYPKETTRPWVVQGGGK